MTDAELGNPDNTDLNLSTSQEMRTSHNLNLMRIKGFEPSLPKKLEPKPSASTNSAISA